jgi:flagellar hook-associated protein 2
MADPIRIGNFFSSFDTEAVIAQLTQARQGVLRQMDVKAATATAKKTSLAGIQAKFSAFLAKIDALANARSVSGKTAQVTGTGVGAAASPTAILGSFTVDVTKLATGTKATGTAITAGLDATLPMSGSNFAITPSNGTYTIGTATGGSKTLTVGAAVADAASLLSASNFEVTPTSGTFTIGTGLGSAVITVDTATQSLNDVITAINAAGVGVTATLTNDANGRADKITLTAATDITLTAGTSNFLTATNLVTASGTTTRVSTAAFTKQMSLNQVIADINAAGVGVTATVTNDGLGKPNLLSLSSTMGNIDVGNATDSSNFWTATNLMTSPPGAARASTQSIARMNLTAKMNVATWDGGAPNAGAQSFVINGVTINYDAANDSLGDVINRIGSSATGVTARYDPTADTVTLQQTQTGSLAITLADNPGGNLLTKLGLLSASQTSGSNAEYKIDGGAVQSAPSNTTTLANGVTLTFSALSSGTPATVSVTQDTASALAGVKAFVAAYNDIMTAIDSATRADSSKTNNQSGVLSGDVSLRQLKSTLRAMVTGMGTNVGGNFAALGQIGLTTGAVGSAVGTTNSLQLDETKFKNALATDPSSVQAVLSAFTLTATLQPGGTSSISGMTGTYTGTEAGTYTISDDGAGHLWADFQPAGGGATSGRAATVTAGGTDTSLISGMTLTIGGVLAAGSHTITVAASRESPLRRLRNIVDTAAGTLGTLQKRGEAFANIAKDIAARETFIQARIDAEMAVLRKKFAAMEQAQARAQQTSSALTQMAAQLTASKN